MSLSDPEWLWDDEGSGGNLGTIGFDSVDDAHEQLTFGPAVVGRVEYSAEAEAFVWELFVSKLPPVSFAVPPVRFGYTTSRADGQRCVEEAFRRYYIELKKKVEELWN